MLISLGMYLRQYYIVIAHCHLAQSSLTEIKINTIIGEHSDIHHVFQYKIYACVIK